MINTALNLTEVRSPEAVSGKASAEKYDRQLAWQERKAASFVLSPSFCGSKQTGYRPTVEFCDGIQLGTALAISGAAISPNWGYHTSRLVAFFLALVNLRLGWWVGNPKSVKGTWRKSGPPVGFWYLLSELLGQASAESRYVYLSDGGHFDNLGIYELVKRRCLYIVCCDAAADPTSGFEDLGNAIRKIRIDFGIDIEIDLTPLRRKNGERYTQWHHAIGTIRYDLVDAGTPVGTLVYIKASLTGDEPADVLEYATRHHDFPHETTVDQFFSESQFESYRQLGYHIGWEVFRVAQAKLL